MKKKLIGPHNVGEFVCETDKAIYVGADMILSPGARDILHNRRIKICYSSESTSECSKSEGATLEPLPIVDEPGKKTGSANHGDLDTVESKTGLVAKITTLLGRDYNITDPDQLQDISIKVMKRLNQ